MADERDSLKMKEINEAFSDYKVQSLEGVILEGDIEIEMDSSSKAQSGLAQSLGQEFTKLALQLFNFSRAMGYPLILCFKQRRSMWHQRISRMFSYGFISKPVGWILKIC